MINIDELSTKLWVSSLAFPTLSTTSATPWDPGAPERE